MSDAPDNTGEKRANQPPVEHQFKPGNPGRPKGARNKLGEAFLNDFLADWEENGKAVIATMRAEKPADYVKVAASILPKELNVKVSELDDLNDAELDRRIGLLASALRLEIGTGEAAGGEKTPQGPQSLN